MFCPKFRYSCVSSTVYTLYANASFGRNMKNYTITCLTNLFLAMNLRIFFVVWYSTLKKEEETIKHTANRLHIFNGKRETFLLICSIFKF